MTSSCFRSTPDGSPIPCGPPTTTLEQVRGWNNRARKLLIISIGQSNSGLTDQGEGNIIDDGEGGLDAPDPAIFELSYEVGLRANEPARDWVGPFGTRHVFQHPAQDDQGSGAIIDGINTAQPNGICMRLPAAKFLKSAYPNIEEITLFCGAKSNSSLQREWAPGSFTSENRQKQIALGLCGPYMRDNPDHDVIFLCSLGETDGVEGMGYPSGTDRSVVKQAYSDALAALAAELRSGIPGAERALWVQADIPGDYSQKWGPVGSEKRSWVEAVIEAQQEVRNYIPLSVPVTIFDLTTYDDTHLDRASVRTMGARMGAASSF